MQNLAYWSRADRIGLKLAPVATLELLHYLGAGRLLPLRYCIDPYRGPVDTKNSRRAFVPGDSERLAITTTPISRPAPSRSLTVLQRDISTPTNARRGSTLTPKPAATSATRACVPITS